MKKIYFLLFIFLASFSYAKECAPLIQTSPCNITSTYNYTAPCNSHIAQIFNSTGQNIQNLTFTDFGDSQKCSITWNISQKGSYYGVVDNGDSFNITVEVSDTMGSFTIVFFLMAFNAVLFAVPFFFNFSQNKVVSFLLKRLIWILSLAFFWFNLVIVIQISRDLNYSIDGQLMALFYIITIAVLISIFIMVWLTIKAVVEMLKQVRVNTMLGENER